MPQKTITLEFLLLIKQWLQSPNYKENREQNTTSTILLQFLSGFSFEHEVSASGALRSNTKYFVAIRRSHLLPNYISKIRGNQ